MDDFVYQSNRIKFRLLTGTVLSSEKRSHTDTYTSTSGGGGYIHRGTGFVNAPQTTTRTVTTTTHEFWLAEEDGTERCVKLVNADIPLREGQRVTMISASSKGDDHFYWVLLVNHSASRYWNILDEGEFVKKFIKRSFSTHGGAITFAPPVLSFLLGSLFNSAELITVLLFNLTPVLWIIGSVRRSKETTKLKKQVESHLNEIAQLAFKS